jgi:hypothetical protein
MKKALEIIALSTALLLPLSCGVKANAQDVKPKIELIINYKTESTQNQIDYSLSKNVYIPIIEYLWRNSNIPELNLNEKNQIENIITDIKNSNITSYQELVDISQNLSDSQKLVLSSAIANSSYVFNYDSNLQNIEVISQDNFFSTLQNSLESGNETGIGVCKHIATHIEKFLNDIGIKSAAVTGSSNNGIGHAYNISKVENGIAIIDSFNILTTNTKNIEKTLEAYQKHNGTTTFQHLFFEDAEFKYRLITKDGKKFLDFIGYDESSEPLKTILTQEIKPRPKSTIIINLEDYLTSVETNTLGFFAKLGEIKGDDSSPLKEMSLFQVGFKRNFSVPDFIKIKAELSFLYSNISQDTKLDDAVLGTRGDLVVATNNEKGFNFSSRSSGNIFETKNMNFFYDFVFGGGISYTIPIKTINIKPYAISQFSLFPKDIGTYNYFPRPSELEGGFIFNAELYKGNFSINPYYIKRIWEQGFGGKLKLGTKSVGINAEGQIIKSDYDFCPEKYKFSVGPFLKFKNLEVKANYQREGTNYDGEEDYQESLSINGSIKF